MNGAVCGYARSRKDRAQKLPLYAQTGVEHAWLMDPVARRVEVFAQHDGELRCVQTYEGEGVLIAPPFEATAIRTGILWHA